MNRNPVLICLSFYSWNHAAEVGAGSVAAAAEFPRFHDSVKGQSSILCAWKQYLFIN